VIHRRHRQSGEDHPMNFPSSFGGNVPEYRDDMARKRLQQKGDLYCSGGYWMLRWHEDHIKEDGEAKRGWSKSIRIGPCEGPGAFTKKQAQRLAWENHLSRLDQNNRTPQSVMTVRQYVERKFRTEHVAYLKRAGRAHYESQIPFVLDGVPDRKGQRGGKTRFKTGEEPPTVPRRFGIGDIRLRDVQREQVQGLVRTMLHRGYGTQSLKHVKTVVSAIFTHAEKEGWFTGPNPARFVKLPEMKRSTPHALTLTQVAELLQLLPSVPRLMAFLAVMTGMNIAEICGLKWKRINLNAEPIMMDDELLPPFMAGVREQWYKTEWGSVKSNARRRNVLLPQWAVQELHTLKQRARWTDPEAPVFAGESGKPLCENAIVQRYLKPAGQKLGMPWLGWHDLRRTFATLADQEKISIGERKELMGHGRAEMTLRYTHVPTERASEVLERMSEKIVTAAHLRPGEKKVARMKTAKAS
jgi:integrase